MIINEIFSSIEGEGIRTGELSTFIRLAGCNLRCSYCDTKYAIENEYGQEMTIGEIIEEVKKYNNKNVTLTGGEPLIHSGVDNLIEQLIEKDYQINIETNGTVDIEKYVGRCLITMDYKCPSSYMEKTMNIENIEKLLSSDVLKFVIKEEDFSCVEKILKSFKIKSYVYLSPVFNELNPEKIVDFMKYCNEKGINMSKVRLQLQLHKLIWNPDKRGV